MTTTKNTRSSDIFAAKAAAKREARKAQELEDAKFGPVTREENDEHEAFLEAFLDFAW